MCTEGGREPTKLRHRNTQNSRNSHQIALQNPNTSHSGLNWNAYAGIPVVVYLVEPQVIYTSYKVLAGPCILGADPAAARWHGACTELAGCGRCTPGDRLAAQSWQWIYIGFSLQPVNQGLWLEGRHLAQMLAYSFGPAPSSCREITTLSAYLWIPINTTPI